MKKCNVVFAILLLATLISACSAANEFSSEPNQQVPFVSAVPSSDQAGPKATAVATEDSIPSEPRITESSIQTPSISVTNAPAPVNTPEVSATNTPMQILPASSTFAVHFLDVGQADAALVLCDNRAMLIDGGNGEDSSLIYSYLKKLNITQLDYMVCTHAHEDHVGGLAGALNYATVGTAFCPVTSYDSDAFRNFTKYLDNQGVSITIPSPGDSFTLGSATVTVLGPINPSDEQNNTSIVLRIIYGDTSFLFAGDAQREEELDILDAGYTLASTVLKVGHHGSNTSTTYPLLYEVMPTYAVISVGTDNAYGHPEEDTLSRLRDADVKVFRTDMQGDIICTSDGTRVSFTVERNTDADTLISVGDNSTASSTPAITDNPNPTSPVETDYVLNTNTKKFHYPWCSSVDQMSDKNKQYYTGNREDVIAQGYSPCGRCNP